MKCKKCGADIAENSKFCGYCGNQIIAEAPVNLNVNNEENLGKTVRIEPIVPNEQSVPVQENIQNSNVSVQENAQNPNANVQANSQMPPKGKNNKLLFIIGGVVLAVVAVLVCLFVFLGSSGAPIKALEKALANFKETAKDSLTVDVTLSIGSMATNVDLAAELKYQKVADKEFNLEFLMKETIATDEMSIFAEVTKNKATLYAESPLLDLTGKTSSIMPMWLYQSMPLDEIEDIETKETVNLDENLEKFFDEKHFVYVDKVDGIRHYQLIIDQELINNIAETAKEMGIEKYEDLKESIGQFSETYKIDFYITKSNELQKISFDLSEATTAMGVSKFALTLEFSGLNSTKVEIPKEAKSSTMTIEDYVSKYAVSPIMPDLENGIEIDSNFSTESNTGFDYNTSFNNTDMGFGI